jgi:hypothetical protein
MKPIQILSLLVLAASLVLAGCSSAPTEATKSNAPTAVVAGNPTKAPAPGYPAPTAPGKPADVPTGYPAPGTGAAQPTTAGYPAPGMALKVSAADGSTKVLDGSALQALKKSTVKLDGKDIEVRKLADVLNAAGIAAYTKVTVNGANGSLALTKDQVSKAYFEIAADGSIQIDVDGMSKDKWISGVQTIKID